MSAPRWIALTPKSLSIAATSVATASEVAKPLSTMPRAGTGKRARDAKAYSACGAGDERDLAVERMSGWGVALHDFDVHREVLLEECSVAFDLRRRQDEASERLAEISAGYRVDAAAL